MAFASFDKQRGAAPLAEINMVPMIDVMLVLLVIFIVTAPLLTHAVKLDLPQVSSQPNQLKPQKIEFAIDAAGQRYWNGERIDRAEAARRFSQAGATDPRTEQSWFIAKVDIPASELGKLGEGNRLQPGMLADVYIRTGERTFLGYLLEPLTDSFRKAWLER